MNKGQAIERYVEGLNAIPTEMIMMVFEADIESWTEVTRASVGENVEFANGYDIDGNLIDCYNGILDEICQDYCKVDCDGTKIIMDADNVLPIFDEIFPAHGTMWTFSGPEDDMLEDSQQYGKDSLIQKLSDAGFRIYYHMKWGWFIGIDGGGYDFYQEHWHKLYDAFGIHWHEERYSVTETSDAFPPGSDFAIYDNEEECLYKKEDGSIPTFEDEGTAVAWMEANLHE